MCVCAQVNTPNASCIRVHEVKYYFQLVPDFVMSTDTFNLTSSEYFHLAPTLSPLNVTCVPISAQLYHNI